MLTLTGSFPLNVIVNVGKNFAAFSDHSLHLKNRSQLYTSNYCVAKVLQVLFL